MWSPHVILTPLLPPFSPFPLSSSLSPLSGHDRESAVRGGQRERREWRAAAEARLQRLWAEEEGAAGGGGRRLCPEVLSRSRGHDMSEIHASVEERRGRGEGVHAYVAVEGYGGGGPVPWSDGLMASSVSRRSSAGGEKSLNVSAIFRRYGRYGLSSVMSGSFAFAQYYSDGDPHSLKIFCSCSICVDQQWQIRCRSISSTHNDIMIHRWRVERLYYLHILMYGAIDFLSYV